MLCSLPGVRQEQAVSSQALGSALTGSSSAPPGSSVYSLVGVSVSLVLGPQLKGPGSKCHGPGLLPCALPPFKSK